MTQFSMKILHSALIFVLLSFLSNNVGSPNIILEKVGKVSKGAPRQLCERAVRGCKPCVKGKAISKVTTRSTITVKDGKTGKVDKKVREEVTETVTETTPNGKQPSKTVKTVTVKEGGLPERKRTYTSIDYKSI
ncbi:Uncharacterized protein PCOAH_00022620 [Plasmodium coatneyi]|uniref:SICA antigen n=1 Tax=Plasmodium coatneyi TaxID=208452 RepID=A0A1B1DYK5_9APIC|nr:Uncharacterized protein PCOAH_00022620 [Plasmodium coatneyi]ANQ07863.1 Uncharacterized protein PCOAH_00022620 [Plasmodium coatneyi]